jgi:hypothetical protein
MKGINDSFAGCQYEVKSFATDTVRNNVAAYGVFHATHTGRWWFRQRDEARTITFTSCSLTVTRSFMTKSGTPDWL